VVGGRCVSSQCVGEPHPSGHPFVHLAGSPIIQTQRGPQFVEKPHRLGGGRAGLCFPGLSTCIRTRQSGRAPVFQAGVTGIVLQKLTQTRPTPRRGTPGLCGPLLHARTASSVEGQLRCGQGIPGTLSGRRLCLAPLSVEGKGTVSEPNNRYLP